MLVGSQIFPSCPTLSIIRLSIAFHSYEYNSVLTALCVCVCGVCGSAQLTMEPFPLLSHKLGMFVRAGRRLIKRLCLGSRKLGSLQFLMWWVGSICWDCMGSGMTCISRWPLFSVPFAPHALLGHLRGLWGLTLLWCLMKKVETSQELWLETMIFLSSWASRAHLGESPCSPTQAAFLPDLLAAHLATSYFKSSVKSSYLKGRIVLIILGDGEEDKF